MGKFTASYDRLIACLLYQDVWQLAEQNRARLTTLSKVNGGNHFLEVYLSWIEKAQSNPNKNELTIYVHQFPKGTDISEALSVEKSDATNLGLELSLAEEYAEKQYRMDAYAAAHSLTSAPYGPFIPAVVDKKMKELYGEDKTNWDFPAYAQIWLNSHLAKNPFKRTPQADSEGDEVCLTTDTINEDDKLVVKNLYTICIDDVEMKELCWLWPDKLALGKVNWFCGKPQNGKSMSTVDVIARVTTGKDWPDGTKNTLGPRKVYAAFSEDEIADTIKPRLRAAGADTKLIKVFTRVTEDGVNRPVDLVTDILEMEKVLLADPDIKLVVFDPLPSFLAGVNMNQTEQARPVMDSLKKLCEKTGVALLGIIHENKRSDVSAVQKIPGDASVAGVARMAWSFSRDTEDKEKFHMSLIKGNITKKRNGLSFTIEDKELEGLKSKAPFIVWGAETEEDADDVQKNERDERYGKKDEKMSNLARFWLPEALKNGPRLEKELMEEAQIEQGISKWQLRRVKQELGIRSKRVGKGSEWSLPTPEKVLEPMEVL